MQGRATPRKPRRRREKRGIMIRERERTFTPPPPPPPPYTLRTPTMTKKTKKREVRLFFPFFFADPSGLSSLLLFFFTHFALLLGVDSAGGLPSPHFLIDSVADDLAQKWSG